MAKATNQTPATDTLTPVLIKQARYDARHLDVFHVCQAEGCTAIDDRLVYCGDYRFTLCEAHRNAAALRKLMPVRSPEPEEEAATPEPIAEAEVPASAEAMPG